MAQYFYHHFRVEFNWWYILLPLSFVLSYWFGTTGATLVCSERGRRIKLLYGGRCYAVSSSIMTVSIIIMIIVESGLGILQVLINSTAPGDSAALADLVFWFGTIFFGGLLFSAYQEIMLAGRDKKIRRIMRCLRRRDPEEAKVVWREFKRRYKI